MRRYWFLVVLLLLLGVIFTPTPVSAQATEMPNLSIICLNAVNIGTRASQHFVALEGSGFIPNQPVEIWRDTEEGFVCAIDKNGTSLCGSEALSAKKNGTEFQVMDLTKDQVVADSNGKVQIAKVRSRTAKRLTHNFYGAQKTAPVVTGGELPELSADEYGLKLLTFLKEQETASPSGANNCTTVFFDPYGRVFDSISLEPISGVAIHLLDSDRNSVPNQPGVINPNLTGADGVFSFFVADGTYYLEPKTTQYTYPLTDQEIASLTASQTIYYELYNGDPIVQQGAIQHRDIPLKPLDQNNPTNVRPVILDKNIVSYTQDGTSYQKISGLVSHPNSLVNVYSGTRLVGSTSSNQFGNFEIAIANDMIDQTLPLEIIAEKVPLITPPLTRSFWQEMSWLVRPAYAETTTTSEPAVINPKPNYLVGFVYDKNGRIAPLSTIEVVIPSMNNRLYASLKSDENGFIFIPKQSLPPVDYQLLIKDPTKALIGEQTSSEFINYNKTFLEKEKVNLLSPQTEEVAEVIETVRTQGNRYLPVNYPSPTLSQVSATEKKDQSAIYIILTLLVLLAVSILIVTLTKFKKRYSPEAL